MTRTTITAAEAPTVVVDYWAPTGEVDLWVAKVAKANRKADRVGLGTPYAIDTTETRVRKVKNPRLADTTVKVHETRVIITGDTPHIPGWSIVASVAWESGSAQAVGADTAQTAIVNTVPGYTGPMLPVPTTKACAHCNKVRGRKDTYLVSGPDGQVEQVGRNCLEAYTGIHVGYVASLSEWEKDEDGGWGDLGYAAPVYVTTSLLAVTTRVVDALGYSARSSGHRPTSADVNLLMLGAVSSDDRERLAEIEDALATSVRNRTEAEVDAEVEALLAWIADETPTSNYIANLQTILADDWVTSRSLGYAVSAVQAYRKHLGWAAERAAKEAVKAEAADVPTGRIVIEGTVTTVRVQESQWGTTLKMRVVSPEGWAVWGSVPSRISEVEVNDEVRFTATVEASGEDPKFGFYKRPAPKGAEIVTTTATEEK